jgi:hypothetical protein
MIFLEKVKRGIHAKDQPGFVRPPPKTKPGKQNQLAKCKNT